MPKQLRSLFVVTLVYCYVSFFNSSAFAATDPISATVSATATVPSFIDTTDRTAPSIPILLRPQDGAYTSDATPELVWRQSSDTGSNVIYYTLYLNSVATFLGISYDHNGYTANYSSMLEGNEVRLIPLSSLPDGVYDWYVTATDAGGNTSRSTTWRFTIDTTPPPLIITNIDQQYDHPTITAESNFDVDGPKDVYFTILSDPFIEVVLTINSFAPDTYTTDANGLAYAYHHLGPGIYPVTVSALDRARNLTTLPTFTLTVHQAVFALVIPGRPPILLPYTPISIPTLPATIARITADSSLAILYLILLALALIILMIILWKRRYNILIIDSVTNLPYRSLILYHSIPTTRPKHSYIFMTKLAPISYTLVASDRGRLYLKHLGRYSTLTLRTDTGTLVLSLSITRPLYTITL